MSRSQRDENLIIVGSQAASKEAIRIDSSVDVENGTETVTISNVAPSGVGTATISKWLPISVAGTIYYIPMWT